jgi:hypothetical protein
MERTSRIASLPRVQRRRRFAAKTMLAQRRSRPRLSGLGLVLMLALSLALPLAPAAAFTDKQMHAIFDALDPDHRGTVTREQFEANKMNAFFYRMRPDASGGMKPVTFEETGFSRAFFDKADRNHDGQLDGLEMIDAVHFEDIDVARRGYFDFSDLVIFLKKIGR